MPLLEIASPLGHSYLDSSCAKESVDGFTFMGIKDFKFCGLEVAPLVYWGDPSEGMCFLQCVTFAEPGKVDAKKKRKTF